MESIGEYSFEMIDRWDRSLAAMWLPLILTFSRKGRRKRYFSDSGEREPRLNKHLEILNPLPSRDCVAINRGRVEKKQVIKRKHRSTAERIC